MLMMLPKIFLIITEFVQQPEIIFRLYLQNTTCFRVMQEAGDGLSKLQTVTLDNRHSFMSDTASLSTDRPSTTVDLV